MDKPDVGALLAQVGEDAVKAAITKVIKPYAQWYVLQSPNKIDDIVLPFMDEVEKALLGLADQIKK